MMRVVPPFLAAVSVALVISGTVAYAEVIDEIVAKINDDIVTKSELETEEQGMLQELYRRYSGNELDDQVKEAKRELLRRLIDRRVLIQRAAHIFDITKMSDFYLEQFKEQQNIKNDAELEKMLAQQDMTMADLKKRLVEEFSPQQVVRADVADRIAVPERDAMEYYKIHNADFLIPAEATVREIVLKANDENRETKRAQAEAARVTLTAAGADFGAIAAEVSDAGTKKAGGLLGKVKLGDLSAALESVAFTLPVGEISPVVEANYGFHILKVDARTDASLKPFEDVKIEIETKIQGERFAVEYKIYVKKAWDEATIWISPKYQDQLSPVDTAN